MNKVLIGSVLACALLLLESPEAAAHEERGSHYRPPAYNYSVAYRRDSHSRGYYSRDKHRGDRYDNRHKRTTKMPKWLNRDRSFRRWFEHTRLRRNRQITWNQLFDVYRWEHFYYRYHRH